MLCASSDVLIDYAEDLDVMYVTVKGVTSEEVENRDSKKFPGIIKLIRPESGECVGFIIANFSKVLPYNLKTPKKKLQELFLRSMEISADKAEIDLPARTVKSENLTIMFAA